MDGAASIARQEPLVTALEKGPAHSGRELPGSPSRAAGARPATVARYAAGEYNLELTISLALASVTCGPAEWIGLSGPIAVVVTGQRRAFPPPSAAWRAARRQSVARLRAATWQ